MVQLKRAVGLTAVTALLVIGCGGGTGASPTVADGSGSPGGASATPGGASATPGAGSPTAGSSGDMTQVALQLQWEPQAQFAGYFAAAAEGYYAEEGLEVEMVRGGAEILPHVVGSDANGPEFTISWVPKVLEVRANGQSDLVDIAQIFQRSGTRSVSWAAGAGPDPTSDEDITSPDQFADKRIGVWDFGNDHEVIAAARMSDLEAGTDFERVIQPFDMSLLLNREIDVAEAMIYNEYAQVLEATNPKTDALYQPEDLNVIDYNEVGTAMLQDAIFAREAWLAEEGNEDVAERFLRASFRGWIFCRDNPEQCIEYTVDAGSTLGSGHQAWMMNEINPLIWPAPDGIGMMPVETWDQTVQISVEAGIIPEAPAEGAYRTDLAEAALEGIEEDATGEGFTKGTVEVTPNGD